MMRRRAQSTIFAAVVRAPDGVRFVTAGQWADEMAPALVDYVQQRCDDVLWPSAASSVRALIAARKPYAAIAEYFKHVGSRWDEERLEFHVVAPGQALESPADRSRKRA
jgi:hypothetical protein